MEPEESKVITPLIRFNDIPDTCHAAEEMISHLSNHYLPPSLYDCKITLSMILSESPCKICSSAILKFKRCFKECSIEIKFSNFFNFEATYLFPNVNGLRELLCNDVQLSVFRGINDWKWFTRDKVGLGPVFVYKSSGGQRIS
jgi:hypothetical protein